MTTLRVIIFALIVVPGLTKAFLRIRNEIFPGNVTEGVDGTVNIRCNVLPNNSERLVLIQFSMNDKVLAVLEQDGISYGSTSHGLLADGNLRGPGKNDYYLSLTLLLPKEKDSGIYKCDVIYMDSDKFVRHISNQSILRVNKVMSDMPAFTAHIARENYFIQPKQTVVFDAVMTNDIFWSYDGLTGIFTVPRGQGGLYAFFLNLEMEGKGTGAGFSLRKNKVELGRLYVEDKDHGDQSSISAVARLEEFDEVKVVVSYMEKKEAYLYHNKYCAFSGYRIR